MLMPSLLLFSQYPDLFSSCDQLGEQFHSTLPQDALVPNNRAPAAVGSMLAHPEGIQKQRTKARGRSEMPLSPVLSFPLCYLGSPCALWALIISQMVGGGGFIWQCARGGNRLSLSQKHFLAGVPVSHHESVRSFSSGGSTGTLE